MGQKEAFPELIDAHGKINYVTKKRRDAAPNPEWVLMYRGGLPGARIAELVGRPVSTVAYHLRVARQMESGLLGEHKAAATMNTRVTAQGLERMNQLVSMVQKTGRYPSCHAADVSERTLATWLQRRRREASSGTLAPAFQTGLEVLLSWQGTPRIVADENRWMDRLAALVAYRAIGQDWPRHKATTGGEEHELGVWLHTQRIKLRGEELLAERVEALNAVAPGWQTGRQRGRRPGGIS